MRLLIRLEPDREEFKVPYNHQRFLQGLIYNRIALASPRLSKALKEKRIPKLFTYSLFMVENRQVIKGVPYFLGRGVSYFQFSSPYESLVKALADGLLKGPQVEMWGERFYLEKVKELPEPTSFSGGVYSTLSPIAVVVSERQGRRIKRYDLSPDDERFVPELLKNLMWKYLQFYGRGSPSADLTLEFRRKRSKRFEVAPGVFQIAWHVVFKAEGDEELLRLGYLAGFGEKNTIGFGMVKKLKK